MRQYEHENHDMAFYLTAPRYIDGYCYKKVLVDSPFNSPKYRNKVIGWEVYKDKEKIGTFRTVKTAKEFIARKSAI